MKFLLNNLRIALKHMLAEGMESFQTGNYRVETESPENGSAFRIFHVKYLGSELFESCVWYPEKREIVISDGERCPRGEIIFIIRTVRYFGYTIERIYTVAAVGRERIRSEKTEEFSGYL